MRGLKLFKCPVCGWVGFRKNECFSGDVIKEEEIKRANHGGK